MNNKIGIIIPTYYRKDGSTIKYLKRAIDSVFNQTYQNFKIFLIGDRYENVDEVYSLLDEYDNEKILFKNLPIAKERDNYVNKWAIWSYGGVNATNVGIDISLSEDYDYICHLDHDDYWSNKHLELINKCINDTKSDWICTKSYYVNNRILPTVNSNSLYVEFLPKSSVLIHSSVCMNFKNIPLRYRDIFDETGVVGLPSDADLWERCRDYILQNNLKSVHINEVTCYHIEEGFERK
jgi:glycosyltransferase involved in cell wall biosynthesis